MEFDIMAHQGTFVGSEVYIFDEIESPMLAGLERTLAETGMNVNVFFTADALDEALERVREEGNAAVLQIGLLDDGTLYSNIMMRDVMSRFPASAVGEIINYVYRWNQFDQLGYDMEVTEQIMLSGVTVGASQLNDFTNMFAAMGLMMLMFMTVYVYGSSVATSVATEKSTRVMETLIVSAKPSRILVGKVFGMGLVGLAQMAGLLGLAGGLGALRSLAIGAVADTTDAVSSLALSLPLALLLIAYFLMGYALYAMMNSMCGAMVSKLEDLNSAMAPAMLIAMFSFYFGGFAPMLTGGGISRATMLIPFTAPFAAPSVLLSGEFDWSLIALSVAIMLAAIIALSWISGKVYSASVLHYGNRLKFSDLSKLTRK